MCFLTLNHRIDLFPSLSPKSCPVERMMEAHRGVQSLWSQVRHQNIQWIQQSVFCGRSLSSPSFPFLSLSVTPTAASARSVSVCVCVYACEFTWDVCRCLNDAAFTSCCTLPPNPSPPRLCQLARVWSQHTRSALCLRRKHPLFSFIFFTSSRETWKRHEQ